MSDICISELTTGSTAGIKLAQESIPAGYPNPMQDNFEDLIDLNRELINHPSTTFCARVTGHSMKDSSIEDGDLLIIDKSLYPQNDNIAVCFIDSEFTLKRISITTEGVFLMPANNEFKPIAITDQNDFRVWGIVTYVIKKIK